MNSSDWIAIIALLVSAVSAGFSVWTYIQTRTDPFQQTLHSKQIDGYVQLMGIAGRIKLLAQQYHRAELSARESIRDTVAEELEVLARMLDGLKVVLPERTVHEVNEFMGEVLAELEKPTSDADPEDISIPTFLVSYYQLLARVRSEVGVEPLTERTLQALDLKRARIVAIEVHPRSAQNTASPEA